MKLKHLALSLLMACSLACGRPQSATPLQAAAEDSQIFKLDFGRMMLRFSGENQPALLQKYWDAWAHATPYLSDAYGLHILRNVNRARVMSDLVPHHGVVVKDEGNVLTLRLHGKYLLEFHFGQKLLFPDGRMGPEGHTYVWFADPTVDELLAGLKDFQKLLADEGLEASYRVPNPYHRLEVEVERHLAAGPSPVELTRDWRLEKFRAVSDGVLVIPDTHGDADIYNRTLRIVQEERFDWLALEMAPVSLQPVVDAYLTARDGTPEFEAAKAALLEGIWRDRIDPALGSSDRNHYYQLFRVARERGIAVFVMDGDPMYAFFGHGETPFGAAVRNVIWADSVPTRGKGVMFGGSLHFTTPLAVDVQDFLAVRAPFLEFFSWASEEAP